MRRRAPQGGFSLLELAVSLVIVAVLSGVLLQRLNVYQREAELANAERVAGVLRSALLFKVSELTARGREGEIGAMVRENPMNWLANKPSTYVGEYFAPVAAQIPAGSWYFDWRAKILVYVPTRNHFGPADAMFAEPAPALHYRLVLTPLPDGPDGQVSNKTTIGLVRTQ